MDPPTEVPRLTVPTDLVGTPSQVERRVAPHVRSFLAGGPWQPAATDEVDVADVPGLLVLSGPAPLLSGRHVQLFLPLSLLVTEVAADRVSAEREAVAVEASLRSPWGLLGLISPPNLLLIMPPERHRAIVDAAVRFWPTLDSPGARYTVGLEVGGRLWDQPTGLLHVLARLGVPDADLASPRDPHGLLGVEIPHE